ncbi:MAG: isopentenyl-diphosphate Delta-isomerase [Chitinophagales bacterium]|nr:isopentenyl-diphosphate Delta-isomerase [Chitinophagales bacterium]
MEEQVVLVNEDGNETGLMGKIEAHEKGVLHKAFSVIILNPGGQMLLQQRSAEKYHWPLIWSNACCSHPRSGEKTIDAANRRMQEELGIDADLQFAFTFQYKAEDDQTGLIEHELDEVFIGTYEGEIPFNHSEVADVKWVDIDELERDMSENEHNYSVWFVIIFKELLRRNYV